MKRALILLISIIVTGQLFSQELTVDDVISKYLKAIGQDNLMKVKTIKTTGKANQGGIEFKITSYEKRPDCDRAEMEIQGVKIILVRDKDTGWMINPVTGSADPQDLPAEAIKSIIDESSEDPVINWDNPFYTWKEIGVKPELSGKEGIGGIPVYNIKFTYKDGHSVNFFIDADKFILLSQKSTKTTQGQTYESETKYSDYRNVSGVLYPSKIESFVNGQLSNSAVSETVEFDLVFNDSLFIKPAKN
ncbi:MAG: hypothetical protein JXR66_00455 [Bacteroidales bacterium]|nr:hypothetical protein [Bacteroidales bacterium]